MSNTLELRGRTVIVTGASSGIGEATARALHAAGARPVLAARRTERLETLSAQLGGALYVQTDVTDAGRVAHLVAATLKRHRRIDALVKNAGASLHDTTIEQLDLGEFHQVLDLNLVSVIRLMQAVLPSMRRQASGESSTSAPAPPGWCSPASEPTPRRSRP